MATGKAARLRTGNGRDTAETVPDGQQYPPGMVPIRAPAHTRIVSVDPRCPDCTVPIAADGRTAIVNVSRSTAYVNPWIVTLKADPDAAAGTYEGTAGPDGGVITAVITA